MSEDVANEAIVKARQRLEANLNNAKSVPKEEFEARPGFHLGGAPFLIYRDLLQEVGAATMKEFESRVVSHLDGAESRSHLEDLWQVEDEWDEFLAKSNVKNQHAKGENVAVKVQGDLLDASRDLSMGPFENVRTGDTVDLGQMIAASAVADDVSGNIVTHLVLLRHLA